MSVNAPEISTPTVNIDEVVGDGASFERVATGFNFVEGPAWNRGLRCLFFSDITGDAMYRWSESNGVSVFREPSNMANGTTWDANGSLLVCEHARSRVSRVSLDGTYEVLASHYGGKELNSPNDIIVSRKGRILFTDPNSGRGAAYGVERDQELDFQGVYQFDPVSGELDLLVDDFSKPNGLCFSRDETRLFINDTDRQHIRVFEVGEGGHLSGGQVWADVDGEAPGVADGMKVDSMGNLYCCGSGGIHVFDPDAHRIGVIATPEFAANFTWGGEDLTDLLVTATHSIYRLRVKIPGFDPLNPRPSVAE